MDGPIRGLGGYVFIQRIPSYALDVVVVLCNLPNHLSCNRLASSVASGSFTHPSRRYRFSQYCPYFR